MEKLTIEKRLEQINPYLIYKPWVNTPHGIGTIIIYKNNYMIEYEENKGFETLIKSVKFWNDDFKLYLRNLSYLTKEIEVNGKRFVPYIELLRECNFDIDNMSKKHLEYYKPDENIDTDLMMYHEVKKLYEWHFAVNIPEHLYIDINTIK